ncbi:MAG: hypothetical protein Q8O63_01605 [Hoeflea sp.]|nr:hypothetical protein [Hoeflea sp.]
MKLSLTTLPLALVFLASTAFAGPVADFETGFRDTYASYRMALFATNSGDPDKSTRAIGDFDSRWRDLVSQNGSAPPPHYADDPAWEETLAGVSDAIAKARQMADDGQFAQSHDVLEHIRGAIGALHSRNGIETFSDRMNAYHAQMERVIGLPAQDEAARQLVREQAAVLAYLVDDMLETPPPEAAGNAEFDTLAQAVKASVAAVQTAARNGDAEAIKAATSGLKVPYSKLFLKFG